MTLLLIQAGDTFGRLTAIRRAGKNKHGQSLWLFRCTCNSEKVLNASGVKYGSVKSCGCLLHEPGPTTQLQSGDRFGKLIAVRFVDDPHKGKPRWLFKCDCGKETITIAPHVKKGRIRSCGCLRNPSPISVGAKFKNWTVISLVSKDENNSRWLLRCACGNERVRFAAFAYNGSESCGCMRKPTREDARINRIFKVLKAGAKRRSYSFILSKSDIANLAEKQNWKCVRSGILLDLTTTTEVRPFGPSIDRIDNERGYEPGNIQLVCNLYNYCKNRFTDADVLRFAEAVVEHSAQTTTSKTLRAA